METWSDAEPAMPLSVQEKPAIPEKRGGHQPPSRGPFVGGGPNVTEMAAEIQ